MFRRAFLFVCVCIILTQATYYSLDNEYNIQPLSKPAAVNLIETDSSIIAIATSVDDRVSTGWTYYYVQTSGYHDDYVQTYAAGYLEGYLFQREIYDLYYDKQIWMQFNFTDDLQAFMDNQTTWMHHMINSNPTSNYWQLVNATLTQILGIYEGYQAALGGNPEYNISYNAIYGISYLSDGGAVIGYLDNSSLYQGPPHCDVLVKLTDNDLIASHATFSPYSSMLKVYKTMNFNLHNPLVYNQRISYTAPVGSVPSQDDYYILNNQFFVAETSYSTMPGDQLSFVHYSSVPYWIRITVANYAMTSPQEWQHIYMMHRSATYPCQWVLVDFNAYRKYQNNLAEASNIVWFVEEFFYLTSSQDVTQELLIPQSYVASYNVPYNTTILEASQNPTNYTNDTRYYLFKKYAPGIQNTEDFQFVMRLNNVSDSGDYCEAIAARCDLGISEEEEAEGETPTPFGQMDCKVTNNEMISTEQSLIINGPTTELGLPPFDWNNWPLAQPQSYGMVPYWDFDWVFTNPNGNFSVMLVIDDTVEAEGEEESETSGTNTNTNEVLVKQKIKKQQKLSSN